jgi:hypothetical protein
MPDSLDNPLVGGGDVSDETTLLDVLDHVLNAGVVIRGKVVISLAGVDLIYLGLDVILTSVETALRHMQLEVPADGPPARMPARKKSD